VEHWQTILTTSHSANGSADSTETFGKPEQPLDKKADNARDLGLDYEVDRGFDKCNKGDICHG
jgi:hypothetical protein